MSDEPAQEEVKKVIRRTLSLEEDNLHYKRPPSIIKDIRKIVEEEVNEIDREDE
jgi:hypothetical protein